jgi:CheY-like chemotaxis protein
VRRSVLATVWPESRAPFAITGIQLSAGQEPILRQQFPIDQLGQEPDLDIRASIINYANVTITRTGDERNPNFDHTVYRMAQPKPISSASRILVADNEPQVRKLFCRKLKSAGYTVSEAGSGGKTLDLLRSTRFDVLVLDLDMPGADGFDVLKVVRSEMPHLRVLVVSVKRELLEAAEWFGAVAAIDKVSAPERLVTTVSRLSGDSLR